MEITKEDDELVVRIPMYQDSYDAADECVGKTDNLIGVVSGDDFTLSQLIDLGYKGTQQEGMPILHFNSEEELKDVCIRYDIEIVVHDPCIKCKKPIYGSHTWDDGPVCYKCE